ncbi:hypothetical protein AB9F29_02715 [Falsihalocynthiibacter sp. S25ZX9]|uniref:hypothetical protein n=1 Tax=Falsihalocynthiibacter sp. S25ZX9 TaxID=3240870 RepID=UPI00350E9439
MDSGWIKALELPAKVTGGVFVACIVIWTCDRVEVLNLDGIGTWLRTTVVLLGILSGCLFVFSVFTDFWNAARGWQKQRVENTTQNNAIIAAQKKSLIHLDQLSEQENSLVAAALKEDSPSFTYWANASGAGQLIAKGLLYSPAGSYHMDHFPFTFHDFAWEEIKVRRDAVLARETECEERRKRRR